MSRMGQLSDVRGTAGAPSSRLPATIALDHPHDPHGMTTSSRSAHAPDVTRPRARARVRVLAAALLVGTAPAAAQPITGRIDFDDLGGSTQTIPQGYGSTPFLQTSYFGRSAFGDVGETRCAGLTLWKESYGALDRVVIPCIPNSVAQIGLRPLAGRALTIGSFDFASYPSRNGVGPAVETTVRIYDENWLELFVQTLSVSGPRVTVSPNLRTTGQVYVQFGRDWNVGLDNLAYTIDAGEVAVVPEPSTVALLGVGLAGVAAGARRRRRAAA